MKSVVGRVGAIWGVGGILALLASAIWRLGATIVFADIAPASFNIDPAAIKAVVSPRTKAIIPVHLFGQCAEMPDICAIAKKHNLLVIEDAAQAIGANYEGRAAGCRRDHRSLRWSR